MIGRRFLLLTVAGLLLTLSTSPALAQSPLSSEFDRQRQDGGVTLTVTDKPSDEDRDWIIVSRRTTRFIDPATGLLIVHETVVRESPPGYRPPPDRLQCSPEDVAAPDNLAPAYSCTYQTSRSVTDSERVYSRTE